MRQKTIIVTEAHIQQTCTQMLELDDWRSLRTSPVSNRARGVGFGELGMADHLYIRYGSETPAKMREFMPGDETWAQVMWVEWKKLKGKAEPHQRIWIELERKRGALVLLAGEDFPASIEGFRAFYKTSGLMRRRIL
jgi:hypothetical protein